MELKEVTSSNVKAIGYESGELYVKYNSNSTYKFKGVPKTLYEELLSAESKGRYINSNVKNKFEFERL